MDHKAWLWRKKSSEKTIFEASKADYHLQRIEEVLKSPFDNGDWANKSAKKALNEKLASVLLDCPAKEEDLVRKNVEEETVEDEISSQQEKEKEEKTAILINAELMECRNQLSVLREEHEKACKALEERAAALSAENSKMTEALLVKERLAEDSERKKCRAEAELGVLVTRLDSSEKENALLKHEFGVVERELRIRTEEMEYYRRSESSSEKRRSQSDEKIAKLEQECERLRALARKRSNAPSGLRNNSNNNNYNNYNYNNQAEVRRRKPNPSRDMVVREPPAKFVFERLRIVEEENEALKRVLNTKIAKPNTADFDMGSEVSSSGSSWAHGKRKDLMNRVASEISLMDDFLEMEKLAIVSTADQPSDRANGKPFDWLQIVLSAMSDQKHISKRSLAELLEDIKIALGLVNSPVKCLTPKESDPVPISGYLTWNSPSEASSIINHDSQSSSLSESASKIMNLIREINPVSSSASSPRSADYFIRVFQWRNSELSSVLQRFTQTCDDLTSKRCDLERFAEEVAFSLDWILSNYVTAKEAVNARDKIKKHFGWSEAEQENGESQEALVPAESSRSALEEENSRLKDELQSVVSEKADMESRLKSAVEKGEGLLTHLQESRQRAERLQEELDGVKEIKGRIEDQIEDEKLISEDLETQLSAAKAKLNEVFQRVSSLEVELEEKRNCCEELEATCFELQLQLESDIAKETPKHKMDQDGTKSQSEWEITAASAKLAECQETIVSLGKQLKALATPKEAAILDKVFSEAENKEKSLKKRSSLRDRMQAEDGSRRIGEPTISPRSDGHDSGDVPAVGPSRSLRCRPGGNGVLAVVPSKKKGGGFDLLKKLLAKRRRGTGQKPRYSAKV